MTEKEWLKSKEPGRLLDALGRKPSKRKRRLFGCACCRRIWPLLPDDRCRDAVVTAERFADGEVGSEELARAKVQAKTSSDEDHRAPYIHHWAAGACYCVALANAGDAAKAWNSAVSARQMETLARRGSSYGDREYSAIMGKVWDQELPVQAVLLLDIFGNPFRPVAFDPAWRTSDVVLLARGIYEERAFDRMPILADALQDAGCDGADILTHCRDASQPHVRGCWVVDLVLGKE